jgi:hypothetical protein
MSNYIRRDKILDEIQNALFDLKERHDNEGDDFNLLCKDSTMESELTSILNNILEATALYSEESEDE